MSSPQRGLLLWVFLAWFCSSSIKAIYPVVHKVPSHNDYGAYFEMEQDHLQYNQVWPQYLQPPGHLIQTPSSYKGGGAGFPNYPSRDYFYESDDYYDYEDYLDITYPYLTSFVPPIPELPQYGDIIGEQPYHPMSVGPPLMLPLQNPAPPSFQRPPPLIPALAAPHITTSYIVHRPNGTYLPGSRRIQPWDHPPPIQIHPLGDVPMEVDGVQPQIELLPIDIKVGELTLKICSANPYGYCLSGCSTRDTLSDNYGICASAGTFCCAVKPKVVFCSTTPVGACQVTCSTQVLQDRIEACDHMNVCCKQSSWADVMK